MAAMARVLGLVILIVAASTADARLSSRLLQEQQDLFFPELPHWVSKIVVAKAEAKPVLAEALQADTGSTPLTSNTVAGGTTSTNPSTGLPNTPAAQIVPGGQLSYQALAPASGSDSAPSSAPPPPGPVGPCGECDFYFQGYQGDIPTFTLPTSGGDQIISPPVEASVKGSVVNVMVLNSQTSEYNCGAGGPPTDNQFYTNQDAVAIRTIQPQDAGKFSGLTVKIPISNAQIEVYNQVFNLNPGDGSSSFPEDRRCLVFKTA